MRRVGNMTPMLNKSIKLLIIDDCKEILEIYQEYFSIYPVYDVFCASTAAEALSLLVSDIRFHICITELGISDLYNDEFYLLKSYARKVSCIVVTKNASPEKKAIAFFYGVKKYFLKPVMFTNSHFMSVVNTLFLNHILGSLPDVEETFFHTQAWSSSQAQIPNTDVSCDRTHGFLEKYAIDISQIKTQFQMLLLEQYSQLFAHYERTLAHTCGNEYDYRRY